MLYGRKMAAISGEFAANTGKLGRELADKPGSVEDNHSSGMRVAAHLKRPTREHVRATRAASSED